MGSTGTKNEGGEPGQDGLEEGGEVVEAMIHEGEIINSESLKKEGEETEALGEKEEEGIVSPTVSEQGAGDEEWDLMSSQTLIAELDGQALEGPAIPRLSQGDELEPGEIEGLDMEEIEEDEEAIIELNKNLLNTLFKFQPLSKLKRFSISKTDVMRGEGMFDPANPSVILCSEDLEEALNMRALHVTEIRDLVLSHITKVPDQSLREKFTQQINICGANTINVTRARPISCNRYFLTDTDNRNIIPIPIPIIFFS
jgi:hypothetical protein